MSKSIAFFSLMLVSIVSVSVTAKTFPDRYYLQLRYNHSSPYFAYSGIREISSSTASRYPHYIFAYDENGRVSEIVCNNPEFARTHHLTNIGAYRTVITYPDNIEKRIYFDKNGNRCANIRKVWSEIFQKGNDGAYSSLNYADENGKPMQSEWNIARYTWEKKGDMIIEHRYSLEGVPVSISPYFNFMTTGIRFSPDGTYRETFNLDDKDQISENKLGIASYRDRYDAEGNHLEFAYKNSKGSPAKSPWQYQKALKTYDEIGNLESIDTYDIEDKLMKSQKFNSYRSAEGPSAAPDNKTRAGRNGVNLAIQYNEPEGLKDNDPIILYIHGNSDGGVVNLTKGKINLLEWVKNLGTKNRAVTIFIQRPGFKSEIGKSDGFEDKPVNYLNRQTEEHIRYIDGAVRSLHEAYPKRPIMLAAHSGGSSIAFSIAAYSHDVIKGMVLSACYVPEKAYPVKNNNSIACNPFNDYTRIPLGLPIHALTGDKDVDCPAERIKQVIDLLAARGAKDVRFTLVPGHTHFTIRPDSEELQNAIRDMVLKVRISSL